MLRSYKPAAPAPTTQTKLCKLQGKGGESRNYFSHAFNRLWMQNGYRGAGELWKIHFLENGKVALEGQGGERGRFLSRSGRSISLTNGIYGEN